MSEKKEQSLVFSYEALPELFHTDPHGFLVYLRRDRLNFLRFWWNYVGENTGHKEPTSNEGLDFTIRELENGTTLTIIRMPDPVKEKGAYFVAMILPKARGGFLLRRDLTRILTLENRMSPDGSSNTAIGEITPRLKHVIISKGPEPTQQAFNETVLKMISTNKV
jgi:hypothetical protein